MLCTCSPPPPPFFFLLLLFAYTSEMSADPNGSRWSKADTFGKDMLKKSGWSEGEGVGKSKDGFTTHVKVSRKDDVLGLGYTATVQETWSTQSVGFADVLSRIKNSQKSAKEGDEEVAVSSPTSGGAIGGKHYHMYAKRNALKTELLHHGEKREHHTSEILGDSIKRKREREDEVDGESTLKSPLLSRLTMRYPKHEPKRSADESANQVTITKPTPRPEKCTDTPFLAS
ncbi:Pin2-interacting protein X1 [Angomonas deanei]|nr:Pin2-interacting protein X1 [Angomonas deanei]|eukprot:EPY43704.1 Pin2-interacting protein X1 [Angomonas deanei]